MRKTNRNKPRLLLGLYARPKHPNNPHYALLITPKITSSQNHPLPASKYHVKNTLQKIDNQRSQPWRFEQASLADIAEDPRLLVAVVVGKVLSLEMVEEVVQLTPVYQVDDPNRRKALAFDCRTWVRDALDGLRGLDCVSGLMDWETLEERALEYVREKNQAGRWSAGDLDLRIPVLDLLTGRELVS